MVNSRQSRFTAAHRSPDEHPLYRGYGVILPSSFTRVLPNACGCSPRPPVSVYGTGRRVVRTGLFVAGNQGSSGSKCRPPCGPGSSSTPYPLMPASPAFNLPVGCGNINPLSIGYAFRPGLRSRLTLGGLAFPRKPWAFGGWASHPSYRYSFRHTHSKSLHGSLPVPLQGNFDALLPLGAKAPNPRLRRDA